MGWPFATWLDWTRKHEAAPTPVWSRIQMFSQKGARPCGQTRAFKAAEKQCVNRGAAHAGLIRASVRAVRPTWNTFSLPSAPVYLNFIHSSRLIKSHLLLEGFSIYEFAPSPGLLLYPQSALGFHVDVDHASLELFLSSRLPSCALWPIISFERCLLADTLRR